MVSHVEIKLRLIWVLQNIDINFTCGLIVQRKLKKNAKCNVPFKKLRKSLLNIF